MLLCMACVINDCRACISSLKKDPLYLLDSQWFLFPWVGYRYTIIIFACICRTPTECQTPDGLWGCTNLTRNPGPDGSAVSGSNYQTSCVSNMYKASILKQKDLGMLKLCCLFSGHLTRGCSMLRMVPIIQTLSLLDEFLSILVFIAIGSSYNEHALIMHFILVFCDQTIVEPLTQMSGLWENMVSLMERYQS